MSNAIKKLAGQIAIYGISSIVGRVFNYFLTPIYTYQFATNEFGVVTEFYAYVSFFVVLLTFGMETAFFRFVSHADNKSKILSTSLWSLGTSSFVFLGIVYLFQSSIANTIGYPEHSEYILWFALILAFDALSAIPLAQLREQNKASKFAWVNLGSIAVNLGTNVFFLAFCKPLYDSGHSNFFIDTFYNPSLGIGYIFIANLLGSAFKIILLSPIYKHLKHGFDFSLFKSMFWYALPILVASFAGMINETLDRALLKYLLIPSIGKEAAMSQLGIYGACYKIAILINLFIQAYRYAAEPFFFKKSKDTDAKKTYAETLFYFTMFLIIIFLGIMTYLDYVMYFVGKDFREGVVVVPILLLANIFLGIYYNLSIWYKLTDKTYFGIILGSVGALITISLNLILIPIYGYYGSAIATLVCYFCIAVLSYIWGQRHYPIDYNLPRLGKLTIIAIITFIIQNRVTFDSSVLAFIMKSAVYISFIGIVYILFIKKKVRTTN